MEPTYKGELDWRVCGIYNALKNNDPIVKAALLDYIITDSIESFLHMRYFYKLRYKVIKKYNVNIKDTIINSEDAIGKYPLFPEWDTVIFINYKNKWIQDYTDGSYHELKMDFIINVVSKYYNSDKNMPKDSISNDIIKSILNRNCDGIFKEYDNNIISKPISASLLKVFIESKRQAKISKDYATDSCVIAIDKERFAINKLNKTYKSDSLQDKTGNRIIYLTDNMGEMKNLYSTIFRNKLNEEYDIYYKNDKVIFISKEYFNRQTNMLINTEQYYYSVDSLVLYISLNKIPSKRKMEKAKEELLIGNALLKTCKIKMANENASLDNATSK